MPSLPAPTTAHLIERAVLHQFAERPTLRSVVTQLLCASVRETYPLLATPFDQLRLALPRDGGGRSLEPLVDVAMGYLANGRFPDLSTREGLDAYLGDATGTRAPEGAYALGGIQGLICALSTLAPAAFQDALAQFWGQPDDSSRWAWLSQLLRDNLRTAAIRQFGADSPALQRLTALADYPERHVRANRLWPENAVHAYTLETQVTWAGHSVTLQHCDILLATAEQTWLYRVTGTLEPYANLDAFAKAWGDRLGQQYLADTLTWRQYEPDGSIFDNQAALVLNQQLEDLAAVQLPLHTSVGALEQRFAAITDPSLLFAAHTALPAMPQVEAELPQWLKQAAPADRFAYRQCLLQDASFRARNRGDSYLNGLDSLKVFAARKLNSALAAHHPRPGGWNADQVHLTFKVAVGDLGSGYLEAVHMTLTELALKNLAGKPKGQMSVAYHDGQPVQAWLTPAYIEALVQQVNIGQTYPQYLREHLMGDSAEAQRREQLFSEQRPTQLVTLALEHLMRGEHGLTRRGYQYVKAVVNTTGAQRRVDADEIVMRPLALLRKPEASADSVENMFIIESRTATAGPHLLLRPSYPDALLQFETRDALLTAIAQPGALQDSVLTWLPDHARPIYSNGGFMEPHYVRVGLGSDFGPLPPTPEPATLAGVDGGSADELLHYLDAGKLMQYLFASEVRTLLDQAERDSTSNTESRWALILEGLQLGFNTVLTVARGPLAIVGWMLQLAVGLQQDIPALESHDPIARELAWVDLLLNVSLLLLHMGLRPEPARAIETGRYRELALDPLRRPVPGQNGVPPAVVKRGTAGLTAEPPGAGLTLVDFGRSVAGDRAAGRMLEQLTGVSVPWPNPLPEPIGLGEFQGLYKIGTRWHASVGGLFFQVSIVPGFGEVFIVHPNKPDHPGIKLKSLGQGRWVLDRGIKLEGGGRAKAQRQQNAERAQVLVAQMQDLNAQIAPSIPLLASSKTQMTAILDELKTQVRRLNVTWNLMHLATPEQKAALAARHSVEQQKTQHTRTHFKLLLDTYEERLAYSHALREQVVKTGVELEKVVGARGHVQDRAKILQTLWDERQVQQLYHQGWAESLQFSDSGEPIAALAERMAGNRAYGDTSAYDEHLAKALEIKQTMQRLADISTVMEGLLEQMEQDSVAGRRIKEQVLRDILRPQYFFADNLKLKLIEPLSWLCVDSTNVSLSPREELFIDRLDRLRLREILNSHVEVRSSTDYPLNEQRAVYETVIKQYRQYENALQALRSINADSVTPVYAEEMLERLQAARALAEHELEGVVGKQEALDVVLPLSKTLRPKAPAKRVFKTRHQQSLIGVFKPKDAQHPNDRIVIDDNFNDATIASFTLSEDVWRDTEEKDVPANPPPMPAGESFTELSARGSGLIKENLSIKALIRTQQRTVADPLTREQVNPGDWDLLLTAQASKLTAIADTLEQRFPGKQTPKDRSNELRAEARDLLRHANEVCSAAYKQQLPTMEGLDYLWRQRQIDINLTSAADPERPTLHGDFFTEYAVYDKAQRPPTVLWYAHFHYAKANAAPAHYTRAHLKLPEQRKYTQKDLLKQHLQAGAGQGTAPLGKIIYVLITPPQDQLFLAIAPRQSE
ncbi:hypothetical protein [Pseudomonas graminis]